MTINFDNLNYVLAVLLAANSKAMQTNESNMLAEHEDMVWTFISEKSEEKIPFFAKEKSKREAIRTLAQHALTKMCSVVDQKGPNWQLLTREYMQEGVNDILSATLGDQAFIIIEKNMAPLYEMITKWDDLDNDDNNLLLASIGLEVRKELLKKGLYKGEL